MKIPAIIKVVNRKTLALVVLSIIATSYILTMFYVQAMSIIQLADATALYPTRKPSLVVTGAAILPQTSVISRQETLKLAENLTGVTGIEYQNLAVIEVNNKPVVIRGLEENTLQELLAIKPVLEGCAWIGEAANKRLGLRNDSLFTAYSPMSHRHLVLKVCGTHNAPWPLSDEIISTAEIAGYLRGISDGQASIAILYFNTSEYRDRALEALGLSRQEVSLLQKGILALRYGYVPPAMLHSFSSRLLSTFNIDKTIISSLLIGLTLLVSLGMMFAGSLAYAGERETSNVLHMLGCSYRRIKIMYTLLLTALSAPASILGLELAVGYGGTGSLIILGYRVPVIYSGWDTLIVSLMPTLAVALGVITGETIE